ncbi:MAG: cation:proton antiporter [Desulfatibacillaceae bacterium]
MTRNAADRVFQQADRPRHWRCVITEIFNDPALTLGIALAAGMIGQSIGHHLRIPGIVILLLMGVLLGPDVLGVVRPGSLGSGLNILTGFAVAVILFEGGMNLKQRSLQRQQHSIRRLILVGGAVSVAGGALATRYVMGWDWRNALLFGTLIMVTGPTVINPLLRRYKVKRKVGTVLEAEGVLIDAVGAVAATVALDAALSPSLTTVQGIAGHLFLNLGFGAVAGVVAGYLLARVLAHESAVPEGTEKVFTLCMVLALYQFCDTVIPESGVAAVCVAGIVVGNADMRSQKGLAEFKEQLTVMLIGLLFVLLAADVRLTDVVDLGWRGAVVVVLLMAVVRPVSVALGTARTDLNRRERFFMGWIGPRGIIAAAVASLFAVELNHYGLPGGNELRALVFVVITATVLWAGLTGGLAARLLGLRRPSDSGWVILGANETSRAVAKILRETGDEVVSIDANPDVSQAAQQDCTRVIFGNGLNPRYLLRAEIDTRAGALALTTNAEVNLLFLRNVRRMARLNRLYAAIDGGENNISPEMIHGAQGQVAFGRYVDMALWNSRLRRGQVQLVRTRFDPKKRKNGDADATPGAPVNRDILPLGFKRNGRMYPVGDRTRFQAGDELAALVVREKKSGLWSEFTVNGWLFLETPGGEEFTTSLCRIPENPWK